MNKTLSAEDFIDAAGILGVSVSTIKAVAEVESNGGGFLVDGRPKILFEAHVFSRLTDHKYDAVAPEISSQYWNKKLYQGGVLEHDRLGKAVVLDRGAALQSASWGMFQIMGFNYSRCGFATVQAFVNSMYRSEAEHLKAFCYIIRSMRLDDELQRGDWAGFARGYNGPSYAMNSYDAKLERVYTKLSTQGVVV